jgi:hypothetical protein
MIKKITLLFTLLATITSAYAAKSTQPQPSSTVAHKTGLAALVAASAGSVAITALTLGKCGLETVYNYCLSQQLEIPRSLALQAHFTGDTTPFQLAFLRESWTVGTTLLVTLGCIQVLKTTYEAFNVKDEKSPGNEDTAD